jgi:hypothetical protein
MLRRLETEAGLVSRFLNGFTIHHNAGAFETSFFQNNRQNSKRPNVLRLSPLRQVYKKACLPTPTLCKLQPHHRTIQHPICVSDSATVQAHIDPIALNPHTAQYGYADIATQKTPWREILVGHANKRLRARSSLKLFFHAGDLSSSALFFLCF